MKTLAAAGLLLLVPAVLWGQTGAVAGSVVDSVTGDPIARAQVMLEPTQLGASTAADGRFRVRNVRPGTYDVTVAAIGYQRVRRERVVVSSGQAVVVSFFLSPEAVELPEIMVDSRTDRLLDPRVKETVQIITAAQLRELPVTTLEEAIALQAGVVGESYRGGRAGQQSFVIDGLGIKNRLDASTGGLGINIPTIALEEATVITNGFSARYGQALSGIVTVVTRDGGNEIDGSLAYESDRVFADGWDVGLDRFTFSVGGPLGIGRIRFLTAIDAQARVDDDPVNAPAPSDIWDPRRESPWLLPHNSGERYDVTGKLTIPIGSRHALRLLGVGSIRNRLLYDQQLKYAPDRGSAEQITGRLLMAHLQRTSSAASLNSSSVDLRVGYFEKESLRGVLLNVPERIFGAFTGGDFEFAGRAIAESADSLAALAAISGFDLPDYAVSPWGVRSFFMTDSPRGELARSRFREIRTQLDILLGRGLDTDFRIGGEYVSQRVETFSRLESYHSVADGAPAPRVSSFSPFAAAGYLELEQRIEELSLSVGIRGDAFNGRSGAELGELGTKFGVSPRFAVSTELQNATVVVSFGRFVQAPDFQFLTDAAFDDTLRTGRSRRGNASLGFETSWQYEFSVRVRPISELGVKVGVYVKRLDGLISSVPIGFDPDSAVFANADFGNVRGLEINIEREMRGGIAGRVTYVIQRATATATDAFDFFRRLRISPIGDTIIPASIEIPLDFDRRHSLIGVVRWRVPRSLHRIFGGIEGAGVLRWSTGLPFTRTNLEGDSLLGIPNGERLPAQFTFDLLLRRSFEVGGLRVGVYLDVRNLTNRSNIVAVRRDTGEPAPGVLQVEGMASLAFQQHPEPIPYESPRYRPELDLDGDGLIQGQDELLPIFQRAARDFLQPIFAFGPPRVLRLGTEIIF